MIIPQGPSCAGDCAVQKGGKLLLPINLLVESVSRGMCVCVCVCVSRSVVSSHNIQSECQVTV